MYHLFIQFVHYEAKSTTMEYKWIIHLLHTDYWTCWRSQLQLKRPIVPTLIYSPTSIIAGQENPELTEYTSNHVDTKKTSNDKCGKCFIYYIVALISCCDIFIGRAEDSYPHVHQQPSYLQLQSQGQHLCGSTHYTAWPQDCSSWCLEGCQLKSPHQLTLTHNLCV